MKSLLLILIVAILMFGSDCSIRSGINSDAVSEHPRKDTGPLQNLPVTDNDVRDATFEKLKLIGRAAVDGDVEAFKANTGNDFHIVLFPKGRRAGSSVISEIKNHKFA